MQNKAPVAMQVGVGAEAEAGAVLCFPAALKQGTVTLSVNFYFCLKRSLDSLTFSSPKYSIFLVPIVYSKNK